MPTANSKAMLAASGWSGTSTVAGKSITFKVPQITGLYGANGKTGTTATTAAELAALITP